MIPMHPFQFGIVRFQESQQENSGGDSQQGHQDNSGTKVHLLQEKSKFGENKSPA